MAHLFTFHPPPPLKKKFLSAVITVPHLMYIIIQQRDDSHRLKILPSKGSTAIGSDSASRDVPKDNGFVGLDGGKSHIFGWLTLGPRDKGDQFGICVLLLDCIPVSKSMDLIHFLAPASKKSLWWSL